MAVPRPDRVSVAEWVAGTRYGLVIDARSEREYADDHMPGAVNMPVVHDDEYAEVGTLHKSDTHQAYLLGVRYSMRNIASYIEHAIQSVPRGTKVLVYCFRGGKRSKLWLDALTTIGFNVVRLEGGWKAYRAWVRESLAALPHQFKFHVLCGPTGCGKTRCLHALRRAGEQVLDLEAIARHRGSLIGYVPGVLQPSQKLFDSLLLDELRALDPGRPVWVEAESKKIGSVALPDALYEAIHGGKVYRVDADMSARVRLWCEDYGHFIDEPDKLIERLRHLRSLVGGQEFDLWSQLADRGEMETLFERLMTHHYDLAYARSIQKNYPSYAEAESIHMGDLSPEAMDRIARDLLKPDPSST